MVVAIVRFKQRMKEFIAVKNALAKYDDMIVATLGSRFSGVRRAIAHWNCARLAGSGWQRDGPEIAQVQTHDVSTPTRVSHDIADGFESRRVGHGQST